jgi:pimeloyl-ACP methyl ester carboxylesterase
MARKVLVLFFLRKNNCYPDVKYKEIQSMTSCPIPEAINHRRRHLFGGAAVAIAAIELGMNSPAAAQSFSGKTNIPMSNTGASAGFSSLKQINAGVLNVGYVDVGPTDGPVVFLLHGWPYDIHSYVDVAPLLASKGYRVIVPYVRGCGTTTFLSSATIRNGQEAAVAVDTIALMDALGIHTAIFGGFDWGGRTADIIAALWPKRCKALVSVSGYLLASQDFNQKPLPPEAEYQWWYQYYFSTQRGVLGYDKYRYEFGKLIWKIASPKWNFDDATYDRTAASFENPDYVAIVIDNYRWRLGLAAGEPQYDHIVSRLAEGPVISVPTITLEGDANGAPHVDGALYRKKFSGKYAHRIITGGIGHNLPQEAPAAFAQAVVDVDGFS